MKRFQYDPYWDGLTKVNDRFEFPTELDVSPWLQENATGTSNPPLPLRYLLSAVVMHVGGPSAGHYYTYVLHRPDGSFDSSESGGGESGDRGARDQLSPPRWLKLDDDRVTEVSEEEVLRDAFGGGGREAGLPGILGQVRRSRSRGLGHLAPAEVASGSGWAWSRASFSA